MDFLTKIETIENARVKYFTFDNAFRDYLSAGNSLNGAYNYFTLEDIERHKTLSTNELELEFWNTKHGSVKNSSPLPLSKHSIVSELEQLNESIN